MNSKKIIKNGRYVGAGSVSVEQKGITLIALVITIIVLLILAGITISMILGDDGIIEQAGKAKEEHENAEKKQNEDLLNVASAINSSGTVYIYSEIDGEIYITGDKVIRDGYKTGDKIEISEGVEGTVVVYGDLNGDSFFDSLDINVYKRNYSADSINCYMLAFDTNHDGVVTEDDKTYTGNILKDINQNVKAQKLNLDEMTDKELIEYLEITNSEIGDKNSDGAYEIALNKDYTYAELYNHINEKVKCSGIGLVGADGTEIETGGNDTLIKPGSQVNIAFKGGLGMLIGETRVYKGSHIWFDIK